MSENAIVWKSIFLNGHEYCRIWHDSEFNYVSGSAVFSISSVRMSWARKRGMPYLSALAVAVGGRRSPTFARQRSISSS